MKKVDRRNAYKIGKRPSLARMKPHNAVSWRKIEDKLNSTHGTASFDTLAAIVKNHESGSKNAPHPYQFVSYCIENEWLVPA